MENTDKRPLIVVNFKDYPEGTGENAVELAQMHEKVAKEMNARIAVAVHPLDLKAVAAVVKGIPVLSQSGDSYTRGADGEPKKTQTGRLTPKALAEIGVSGILVNHAENPVEDDEHVAQIVEDFKGAGMMVIACAENTDRGESIQLACPVKPDFIAVEPPEMIGGDVSVTTKPEVITEAVQYLGDTVLVGAGVKTGEDIKKAKELGAKGVLLASGVVTPKGGKTPEEVLRELAQASLE